ncbi:MAG: hypothetical protein WA947_08445 [Phormidesmis sp.]
MSDEFIRDDTDLSLLERTNFQVVSTDNGKEADNFADEVEELGRDDVEPARSPWVRIGIAVAAGSFILGLGAMLSLGDKKGEQVVKSTDKAEETALTLELEEPTDTSTADANRSEMDEMRSELALLEQQLALSNIERDPTAANAARGNASGSPGTQAQSNQTQPKPDTKPVSSVRVVPASPPRATPAARPPAPRPVAQPSTRTVVRPAPAAPAAPSFSGPSSRPEPVDPQQAWLAASTAGVFGSMPPMEAPEAQLEATTAQEAEPEYQLQAVNFVEVQDNTVFPSDEPVPGLFYSGALTIPMGSAAKATVVSPIAWIGENDQFILELSEDILSNSEQVAIPAGALIAVQPVSVDDDSGLAELAAVGVELDGEMIPIDYQKVAIRGEDGDPLIAERYGDIGSNIAANDLEMFAVGALGGIGEILTRPDSQTVTTGTLSSSSSTDFGDRNILGAILAGGTRDLTGRMADRNDERLDEIRSRGVIYYLPKGAEVQFYVNSEFQL